MIFERFGDLAPVERGHIISLYDAARLRARDIRDREAVHTWWALREYIVGIGPRPDIKAIEEQENIHTRNLFLEDEVKA
ncbi:MAG: hypothetical protein ACKVT1_02425 [Dehalococcoidia bacterium]